MEKNRKVKSVAIYARESAGRDEDSSVSVADQVAECKRWAEREGWDVVETIRDVGSASKGARRRRSRLSDLVAVIENGSVDAVIAWEQSRFARTEAESATISDLCEDSGVLLGYGGQLYDMAKTDDRLTSSITATVSAAETRRTRDRIRRRTSANAQEGRPHGKNLYGYAREYATDTSGHHTVSRVFEHPEQGPIVRRIFSEALGGVGAYTIAKGLNVDGVPPRRPVLKPEHRLNLWTAEAVRKVLRNPAYAGKRVYQGKVVGDAIWEGLVSGEDFAKVQALIAGRSRPAVGAKAQHLCSGIAICAVCGSVLTTSKQNAGRKTLSDGSLNPKHSTYRTYLCTGSRSLGGFHVAMKEEHLDLLVTEAVIARLERPDFLALAGAREDSADTGRKEILDEIARLTAYLEEVRQRASEELNLSMLIDQEARVKPKIESLRRELEKMAGFDPAVNVLAASDDIRDAWEALDLDEKRRVIRALVLPVVSVSAKRGRKGIDVDRVRLEWK